MKAKTAKTSGARRTTPRLATLFLIVSAVLTTAEAKDRRAHASEAIAVVANITFEHKPIADMLMHQVNGKPYLYVQLANAQGAVVVDISKPNKPRVVGLMSGPQLSEASDLSIAGNEAIMMAVPAGQQVNKSDLVIWDISHPERPRVVQRFSAVVRVLRDDERHYTYVLTQDGLWVVADKKQQKQDDAAPFAGIYN